MSFDLIVKGGTLPDGNVADIGIKGDRIAAIEPRPVLVGRRAAWVFLPFRGIEARDPDARETQAQRLGPERAGERFGTQAGALPGPR